MRTPGWRPLAAMLTTSGVAHLLAPGPFDTIVPAALGAPRPWVTASGVAELACAAGLAAPRLRARAGWACAALLVAVYPANVTMALRARPRAPRGGGPASAAARTRSLVALARLPLQVPLVWWAVSVARTPVLMPATTVGAAS